MNINDLIQYLGFSHKNKMVNKALRDLGFITIPESSELHEGVPFYISHKHSSLPIELTFNGYNYFIGEYGKPKGYNEKNENELFLICISINFEILRDSKTNLKCSFPFNINQTYSEISETLNKEGISVKQYPDGGSHYYASKGVKFTLGFNSSNLIKQVIITLEGNLDKALDSITKNLLKQKDNILKENSEKVLNFKNPVPNLDWEYQAHIGSENAKQLVTKLFMDYRDRLVDSTIKSSPEELYNSVKTIVLDLNNAQDNGLQIDTDERELLCEAIESLLLTTGFDTKDTDLTIKWRNW